MRSHYVAQVGLELVDSNNPPILASQSAEIIGMILHWLLKASGISFLCAKVFWNFFQNKFEF